MKTKKLWTKPIKYILTTLLIPALSILTACSTDITGTPSVQSDQTQLSSIDQDEFEASFDGTFEDEVVVGRVAPLTGSLATFGEGSPYIEERIFGIINDKGGVNIDGKRCKLVLNIKDSGSTSDGAAQAAMELIQEGIDIMIVSHTDDTVSPVSAVCEREGVACISVDAPASAWAMGGPYTNSWHTFFDNEREMLCFYDAWESIDTNKTIGLMTANDSEGIEIGTFIHDFADTKGYTVVDVGSYYVGEVDYSEYIDAFEKNQCDIILGVMVNEDFVRFWTQLQESDYMPKMCTMAKACLFESDVQRLGKTGDGLITEVWWNESFPFVSSITGISSHDLAEDYLIQTGSELKEAPATVGYKYANVEILYDILKRAGSLDLDVLNAAAASTDLDTIIGHVRFNYDHISVMSCVTGQWILEEDGTYHREIVGNYLIPNVKTTAETKVLEK